MAPILPGLSDEPSLMADVVKAARDAGAAFVWTNLLQLRAGTREHFLANLARDWPELVPKYGRLQRGRDYLPKSELEPLRREVAELRDRFGIDVGRHVPKPVGAVESRAARSRPPGPHAHLARRSLPVVQLPLELPIAREAVSASRQLLHGC